MMTPPHDTALETAVTALPGAVALLTDRTGETYVRAFGLADAVAGVPMRDDTVFQIASMTKAIVSFAALQLVEAGKLSLDAPIGDVLPALAAPRVLSGWADDGTAITRPAASPITLRHLLTHTAGLGYSFVQPDVLRHFQSTAMPAPGSLAAITMPLLFDPGQGWEYSVATDWAGLAVEAASGQTLGDYLAEHIFAPLGMAHTGFRSAAEMPADAAKVHVRLPGGGWKTIPVHLGGGEFHSGGGGLSGTARDYGAFIRAILNDGRAPDGTALLGPAMIAEITRNQIGAMRAGAMGTSMPEIAAPFDPFPDQHSGWSCGFLVNPEPGPAGRPGGSLSWAGIFNTYYWIDRAGGVGGVFMSQLAPFGDAAALAAYAELEKLAYA